MSTRTFGAFRRDVQIAQASAAPYSSYGGSSSTYDDGQWHGGYSSGSSYDQQAGSGQSQSGTMSSGSGNTGSSGTSGGSYGAGSAAQASPVASTENSASSWSEGSSASSGQGNTQGWSSQYVQNAPSPSAVSVTWETSAIPTQTASWTSMTSSTSTTSNTTPTGSSTTETEAPASTTTAASAAGTSHVATPQSTKLAIGLSIALAVVAILGFFVWSLHRKKRALQRAIAGHTGRNEKPDPSPQQPSMMKRCANSICNGASAINFKSAKSRLRSTSMRLPGAPKAEYKPIKDLALKVYANGRGMLRTAANIARSTWKKSNVHVPRPASEYMHDPNSVVRGGKIGVCLMELDREKDGADEGGGAADSCLSLPHTPSLSLPSHLLSPSPSLTHSLSLSLSPVRPSEPTHPTEHYFPLTSFSFFFPSLLCAVHGCY